MSSRRHGVADSWPSLINDATTNQVETIMAATGQAKEAVVMAIEVVAEAVVVAEEETDQDIVAKVVVINHFKLFNRTDRTRIRETNADHTMVAATTDHKTWRR